MHLSYDENARDIHLTLDDSRVASSEEVRPGVTIHYDDRGVVIGIRICRMTTDKTAAPHDSGVVEPGADNLPPARTPVVAALRQARARMREEGMLFLSLEELDREISERRGVLPEQRIQ